MRKTLDKNARKAGVKSLIFALNLHTKFGSYLIVEGAILQPQMATDERLCRQQKRPQHMTQNITSSAAQASLFRTQFAYF